MGDHRIRHSAWPVLVAIAESGGNVHEIPPGPDGWHSRESLADWLAPTLGYPAEVIQASFGNLDQPGSFRVDTGGSSRSAGLMTPAAAAASGRITARSRPEWDRRYAADPAGTAATLASLAPVWSNAAREASLQAVVEEPDEPYSAVYGHSQPWH